MKRDNKRFLPYVWEIKGGFYEYELMKTKFPDTYLVEKVIIRRNGRAFVEWLGFSSEHNSWIDLYKK